MSDHTTCEERYTRWKLASSMLVNRDTKGQDEETLEQEYCETICPAYHPDYDGECSNVR